MNKEGTKLERRACQVLVSNHPDGPYVSMADATYLPANKLTLDGPWIQQKTPVTPPNYGHGMLFKTFDGRTVLSVHSHRNVDGRYIRVPHFFYVDLTGNELKVLGKVE